MKQAKTSFLIVSFSLCIISLAFILFPFPALAAEKSGERCPDLTGYTDGQLFLIEWNLDQAEWYMKFYDITGNEINKVVAEQHLDNVRDILLEYGLSIADVEACMNPTEEDFLKQINMFKKLFLTFNSSEIKELMSIPNELYISGGILFDRINQMSMRLYAKTITLDDIIFDNPILSGTLSGLTGGFSTIFDNFAKEGLSDSVLVELGMKKTGDSILRKPPVAGKGFNILQQVVLSLGQDACVRNLGNEVTDKAKNLGDSLCKAIINDPFSAGAYYYKFTTDWFKGMSNEIGDAVYNASANELLDKEFEVGNIRTTMRKVQHTIHLTSNSSVTLNNKDDVENYFNVIKSSLGDSNGLSLKDYEVFPLVKSVPEYKTWKITFSQPISKPIPENAIKVLDQDGFPAFIDVVQGENNTILVKPPIFGYDRGEKYQLFITQKITSAIATKSLVKPVMMEFIISE